MDSYDYYSDSDGFSHGEEEDTMDEDDLLKPQSKNYTVMTEADLRQHQEDAIAEVCAVLSVSRSAAVILLLHHHWGVSNLHEAWFADEDGVRKAVGLSNSPPAGMSDDGGVVDCGICFDSYPLDQVSSAACKHYYCIECWRSYIGAAVEDGERCLTLRCPEPSCRAAVGQDMIDSLACTGDKRKYAKYLARSYVELNRATKWCPAPGCEKAIQFVAIGGDDVYCECMNGFCWKCDEEAHSPMDCETVNKWITKNNSESENTTWILANSKPCPKCRKPIEKNQGCMHMTCRPPCQHQFCWICLGDWSKHGSCNGYREDGTSGVMNEDERRRQLAKKAIERYTHYYERWAANHKSWKQALEDLRKVQTENSETLGKLSETKKEPVTALAFIVDAWKQVVECRRVLKWTYAYGYYLPEEEKNKKQFFEYLQGEAETCLDRLHSCAEHELKEQTDFEVRLNKDGLGVILDKNCVEVIWDEYAAFAEYRKKLVGLTSVTRTYFEKLVTALENGLPDVKEGGGSSSGSYAVGHLRNPPWWTAELEEQPEGWVCDRCTFWNQIDATACQMCYVP